MSKGNRTKGPRVGRPRLPKGETREVLPAQRVAPATLAYLDRMAPHCGGIGKAIDHACAVAAEYGRGIGGPVSG